jgi:6-phosphogluconolactonase
MARLVELQAATGRVGAPVPDRRPHRQPHLRGVRRPRRGLGLDPSRIELWWGDERFVPTEDPDRNAGHTLAILARTLPLTPRTRTPMSAADGVADNDASALTYAKELGDTRVRHLPARHGRGRPRRVDLPRTTLVRGDDPHGDRGQRLPQAAAQRISLTVPTLNRSREVWFLVSGADKATPWRAPRRRPDDARPAWSAGASARCGSWTGRPGPACPTTSAPSEPGADAPGLSR